MNKFDDTVKELKEDIKDLENEFSKRTKGLDESTKQKAYEFVENTENVINSSINKIAAVIENLKDDEELNDLLDKVKAKAKEAIDFAVEKIDAIINGSPDDDLDRLHDEIMDDFDKLKGTDLYKTTTVLLKEGYAKLNEFLEKPEVKQTINKAKKTTIDLAEKGVAGLKKVLIVEEEPKKTKSTKKATKTTKAKTTKTTKTTKTKKKAA